MTAAAATPSGLYLRTLMITATVPPMEADRPTIWLRNVECSPSTPPRLKART